MPKPDDSHLDGPNALDDSAALDESGAEEREPESRAGLPTETRVIRALQVAGVLGFTLLIVGLVASGLVASRLRPPVLTGQRSLVTTPFLWAIVLWTAALVFDAVAFRTSQLDLLIKRPLQVAAALSGALLVVPCLSLALRRPTSAPHQLARSRTWLPTPLAPPCFGGQRSRSDGSS